MGKDKIYEVTDEDRTFFDELVDRSVDPDIQEELEFNRGIQKEITEQDKIYQADGSLRIPRKMPDWYQPHMKYRVGWLNGVPQKPLSREDRKREYGRGRWVGSPEY